MTTMQFQSIETILVLSLLMGYLVLWKAKKHTDFKRTGINPEVIYSDTRPTQQYFARLSRVLTALVVALIGFHTLDLSNVPGLVRIEFLNRGFFDVLGFAIGISGLWLCRAAQVEMGHAWRVGIDRDRRTDLVTTGVFEIIRNPTYSGLFLLCLGVWLIFPTAAFLAWWMVFFTAIEFQVRMEEEFLTKIHGDSYLEYCRDTGRYLPAITPRK